MIVFRGHRSSAVFSSIATILLLPILFTFTYASSGNPIFAEPQLPLIPRPIVPNDGSEHTFTLRHVFHQGGHLFPQLARRLDIKPGTELTIAQDDGGPPIKAPASYHTRSRPIKIQRLMDRRRERMHNLLDVGRERGQPVSLAASEWTIDEISGPNVTDQQTVLDMAKIAANAYAFSNDSSEWYPIGHGFNYTNNFGWESDGLRGHVFADEVNKTVIISIKGTSLSVFNSGTSRQDRENDNLLFSCCCGQGESLMYTPVCDCQTASYTCNSTCLTQELRKKHHYYYKGLDLYQNVTELYPQAEIWMVGHSLGGSVSSLVGATYGRPVVTFEAPGEAMASKRLGLPTPPGYRVGEDEPEVGTGAYHFGHTADPLFLGTCNGYICSALGHAMQSVCHTGHSCIYNTTRDLQWNPSIQYHRIGRVIEEVIKVYDAPPECKVIADCTDCYKWKYRASNHSDSTTTTKPSSTRATQTRTEICKTPGWWGCLDEPSTGISTSTSTPTSTCRTPGWFGCKDPVTSTAEITTSSTVITTTTTCETPGWFGCNDPTTTSHEGLSTSHDLTKGPTCTTSSTTSTSATTSTCVRPGFFWGCRDAAKPGSSPNQATPDPTAHHQSL